MPRMLLDQATFPQGCGNTVVVVWLVVIPYSMERLCGPRLGAAQAHSHVLFSESRRPPPTYLPAELASCLLTYYLVVVPPSFLPVTTNPPTCIDNDQQTHLPT